MSQADEIERRLKAFDALLAVAKAVDADLTASVVWGPHQHAIAALDAAAPDWRTWT